MGNPGTSSSVLQAQFRSFAKKMPAYYGSVIAMMLAIVYVYHALAPAWLAYAVPGGTSVLAVVRGFWWLAHGEDDISDQDASAHLRRATWTLIVSAFLVISTDTALFRYGNDHTRDFLLLQMVVSAMCGFYCLMHLRRAALVVFAVVMVPFDVLTLALHQRVATIGALTATVTAAVMIVAMRGYQRDFYNLVRAEAETKELSRENLRLAHLDMLTGLPNRRHFFELLGKLRPHAQTSSGILALGMIDLDGFKPVNDTYGHAVGDRVLAEISSRLSSLSPAIQSLSRLGGDEFAFLVQSDTEELLLQLGERIIREVSRPVQSASCATSVGCSIGLAPWPREGNVTGQALFERTDYALYHAKRTGRGRTVLFSEEHERLIREQGLIEQGLRAANLHEEFYLLYQPIVELHTGNPLCFEALARWSSPLLGEVSPARFIPVAESSGLIGELTLVLLEKALIAAAGWPHTIGLSFNVSPQDISSAEQVYRIISLIEASGVSPARLTIELTETALLNSFKEVSEQMERLRRMGVAIALDDFGTGHSSLSYVHALPLDKIKIDRSFVRNLESHGASHKIVRSVIGLCRDLSVVSVVEGVETDAQLETLETLGAAHIQGYLFAKPLPEPDVCAYIDSSRALQV